MAAAASYYEPLSATHTQPPMTLPSFDPYAVAPPPPPPISIPGNNFSHGLPTPSHPHRASSGAWSAEEDQTLLAARAQGLNWSSIQSTHFPSKTSNACRKRHERLMERRGADDWDARKLERLAQEYMKVRKEIWQPLARITGEKWNVVEQKVRKKYLVQNIRGPLTLMKGMTPRTDHGQRHQKPAVGCSPCGST